MQNRPWLVTSRPWLQALALLLLAVLPALIAAGFHPKRPAWTRDTLAPDEISVTAAQATLDVIWVDARPTAAYAREHIPGAILLNEDDWNSLLLRFTSDFQPNQTLVVYCDSLECNASRMVAERLRKELGAQKVFVLKGGWQSWKDKK